MRRALLTCLIALLLSSCATQTAKAPVDPYVNDGEVINCPPFVPGKPFPVCHMAPYRPTMNLGKVVTDLATIPLRLPDAMISNYPSGGRVYCRSSTYNDQLRTTCY